MLKIESWQLRFRQNLSLEIKEKYTEHRIKQWYNFYNGHVYVSFSGGKDSLVLLSQVRNIYPTVPAVFVNTGLEYPEIKEFVRTIPNVIQLKPKIYFVNVIENYGYPIISKEVSMAISRYRNTKSLIQKELRLHGGINPNTNKLQKMGVIPKKYHVLIDAPFKISEKCCDILKKAPIRLYEKETGRKPYIATMAEDNRIRNIDYLKNGCNSFESNHPKSIPMSFWKSEDVWNYIKKYNISYSKIYDMGEDRTGCIFCMFGVQMENTPNRFQRLKLSHEKLYHYCMENLKLKQCLDYIGVPY